MSSAVVTIIVELWRDVNTKLYDREVLMFVNRLSLPDSQALLEVRIRAEWALSMEIQLTVIDAAARPRSLCRCLMRNALLIGGQKIRRRL
jgi:hypothetical protein